MAGQVYIHRAVIVPGAKRGRVFASLDEAPAKVRKVFENGSVVTIVIAGREARDRITRWPKAPADPAPSAVSTRLANEVLAAAALIGTLFYFALSR